MRHRQVRWAKHSPICEPCAAVVIRGRRWCAAALSALTRDQAQTIAQVQAVASRLADHVEKFVQADHIPLVIGGDCMIIPGVLAGFIRRPPKLSLPYLD
jgi:arginase family enzyme